MIVGVATDYWTIDQIIHTSKVNIYCGSNGCCHQKEEE